MKKTVWYEIVWNDVTSLRFQLEYFIVKSAKFYPFNI